jgi:hypothetical protein
MKVIKTIKVLIMVAAGIALAYGGIQWTIQTGKMYTSAPEVIVGEDFNLIVHPAYVSGRVSIFPAVMGIFSGIVWICCAAFAGSSLPGAVYLASGIMLIPIGILNFLRSLFIQGGLDTTRWRRWELLPIYPSSILRFLFVDHPRISIFIFAAAAFVFCCIGAVFFGFSEKSGKQIKDKK